MLIPLDVLNGSTMWVDNAPLEFQKRLKEGAPEYGWDGDINLFLFLNPNGPGWYILERIPGVQRPNIVIRSIAPHKLDERVFQRLAEMRFNAKHLQSFIDANVAHNESLTKKNEQNEAEFKKDMDKDLRKAMQKDNLI